MFLVENIKNIYVTYSKYYNIYELISTKRTNNNKMCILFGTADYLKSDNLIFDTIQKNVHLKKS